MRPFSVPEWSLVLPYEPGGLYTVQVNTTVTTREYNLYMLASAGVNFAEWANPVLLRRAQTWKRWGPGPAIPRFCTTQPLRFCTVAAALKVYKMTAQKHGYSSLSKWVRDTINQELGI